MKYLIRYFSVFLSLVLLSAVFSITANAEDNTLSNYEIFTSIDINNNDVGIFGTIDPFNESIEKFEYSDQHTINASSSANIKHHYLIKPEVSPIIKKGNEVEISFFDVYYSVGIKSTYDNTFSYDYTPTLIRLLVTYTDNTQTYYDSTFTVSNKLLNITNKFTPNKDVKSLEYIADDTIASGNRAKALTFYIGEFGSSSNLFSITYTQETEETGLLKGIIEWLKGIKQGITDLFNSIAELPSKIWSFIENGLKSLFIPDSDFVSGKVVEMTDLLLERLGAVGEVVMLTLDWWGDIDTSDVTNTIKMPKTTINLGESNFSFGGFDVVVVPQGFESLADICKVVIGTICTLLFINGLRKRYDEVMGVEQ